MRKRCVNARAKDGANEGMQFVKEASIPALAPETHSKEISKFCILCSSVSFKPFHRGSVASDAAEKYLDQLR